jgi:WhiB family transcriptional regulator, redox-sensing transcriptional regulator
MLTAPPSDASPTSWEHQAACKTSHAVFYPPAQRESDDRQLFREAQAKRVCAKCPVCAECLAYAVRIDERLGIWGGLTATERRGVSDRAAS